MHKKQEKDIGFVTTPGKQAKDVTTIPMISVIYHRFKAGITA
jgi:hypothetical protein